MHTAITYGTFDLFHIGHVRLLNSIKHKVGADKLIVAVSTEEFNTLKGKKSQFSFQERLEIVSSLRAVDEVILEHSWDQKIDDILKYNVKTFVMGDDWQGKFDFLKPHCDVVYLPRTCNISSTAIKQAIKES